MAHKSWSLPGSWVARQSLAQTWEGHNQLQVLGACRTGDVVHVQFCFHRLLFTLCVSRMCAVALMLVVRCCSVTFFVGVAVVTSVLALQPDAQRTIAKYKIRQIQEKNLLQLAYNAVQVNIKATAQSCS